MNNPVLGAARNSFQTLAKLIYLLRSHYEFDGDADDNSHYTNDETFWELILALNDQEIDQVEKDNVLKLNQLLKIFPLGSKTMVTSHTGEQLSYSVLRSNLAVSIITIHACKILAAKLINPKIPAYLPEIQHLVSIILEELSLYIPQDNYSSSICIASLFFCGVAIINKPQQDLLCYKLSNLKNNLSQIVANNLISILKSVGTEKQQSGLFLVINVTNALIQYLIEKSSKVSPFELYMYAFVYCFAKVYKIYTCFSTQHTFSSS